MEKMYWFSTNKHGQDIIFRSDRLSNEIREMEENHKPVPDKMYDLQEDLDEIIGYISGACGQPVKLPGRLYGIAMESAMWAASVRG